ncbi:MAG: DUF4365 domain-containing protein [Planctomycetota bacterium]|jgi:hypothetical protein
MARKQIHVRELIAQQGINLIEKIVLDMGFVWRPTSIHDAGIDGEIEIRDAASGEPVNCIIKVQSKATTGKFTAETDSRFEYMCRPQDLDYWLSGNIPVILVVSRPSAEEAYWVCIGEYLSNPTRVKERRICFDKKTNRFDKTSSSALIQLSVPTDSGLYFPPLPQKEKLFSNLVEVSYFPKTVYLAGTDLRLSSWFWARAKDHNIEPGNEWVLTEKSIMSFHNLREKPWDIFCDRGSVEAFDVEEWAYTDDKDKQRHFVQLLKKCLNSKLRAWAASYRRESDCYCVWATKDLTRRIFTYRSKKQKTSRDTFVPYKSKTTEGRIAYYRHSAFEGRFLRFDEQWYLEINPTYVFTSNGYNESRYAAERLAGIKRLEKNDAVLGQLIMWQRFLTRHATFFKPEYPFLRLGKLVTFDCEQHIDDGAWVRRQDPDVENIGQDNEVECGLFAE